MHQELIDKIKEQYTRDLRKKLIKSIIVNEKNSEKIALKSSYSIVNQIFSYIISELNWSIPKNTTSWDNTPLEIMSEIFPKIETTEWYKEQKLNVTKLINLEGNFN